MSEKYELIGAECAFLPAEGDAPAVVQMCEWLGVSPSGFYDWRNRPQSETAQRRELLKIKTKALFEANNEEYGYRRIHAALVPTPRTFFDYGLIFDILLHGYQGRRSTFEERLCALAF